MLREIFGRLYTPAVIPLGGTVYRWSSHLLSQFYHHSHETLLSCLHSIQWCSRFLEISPSICPLAHDKRLFVICLFCSSLPTWLICHRFSWCHGHNTSNFLSHTVSIPSLRSMSPMTTSVHLIHHSNTPQPSLLCSVTRINPLLFSRNLQVFRVTSYQWKRIGRVHVYIFICILHKHVTVSLF